MNEHQGSVWSSVRSNVSNEGRSHSWRNARTIYRHSKVLYVQAIKALSRSCSSPISGFLQRFPVRSNFSAYVGSRNKYKNAEEHDCWLDRIRGVIMSQQQTENGQTTDACLQLGDMLIVPKIAHCSPLQSFYGRQPVTLQLKQLDKGRQFLRLAIALVGSLGKKSTAVVLTRIFEHQDGPRSCVTSSQHVEELLPANEFRAKAQFRSLVSEWRAAVNGRDNQKLESLSGTRCDTKSRRTSDILADTCPDEDSLVSLINVLCNAIKEGGQVKVFTSSCWPWVMALLEWLYGPRLDGVAGKLRFRCHISVVLVETDISNNTKSLRVVHRKRAAEAPAKRRPKRRTVTG